jgi:hypothetical protein
LEARLPHDLTNHRRLLAIDHTIQYYLKTPHQSSFFHGGGSSPPRFTNGQRDFAKDIQHSEVDGSTAGKGVSIEERLAMLLYKISHEDIPVDPSHLKV